MLGFIIFFLMAFFYGYFRKRRGLSGFGLVGWFFVFASTAVAIFFLILEPAAGMTVLFVFLPALLFYLGFLAGQKMDLF